MRCSKWIDDHQFAPTENLLLPKPLFGVLHTVLFLFFFLAFLFFFSFFLEQKLVFSPSFDP
jgi:hypothetical protein